MKSRVQYKAFILLAVLPILLSGCGDTKRLESQKNYRQYGINCMRDGNYEEAVEAFQNALDQSLGKVGDMELDICFYKAEAQLKSGAYEDALDTYNALIAYNESSDAYYLRGCLYFLQGDSEAGKNDFAVAVKKNAGNYDLYVGIYQTMSAYNLLQEGEYYLQEALKIKGETAQDYLQKGRIYYLLGDMENAGSSLEAALEKDAVQSSQANYYLALIAEAAGDAESAEAYFNKYLEAGEADSISLYTMGEQRMKVGDYAHAITYFQAGLGMEEMPNQQELMRNLIICYEYSGDFQSAKIQMETYMQLFPDDEEAKQEQIFLSTR